MKRYKVGVIAYGRGVNLNRVIVGGQEIMINLLRILQTFTDAEYVDLSVPSKKYDIVFATSNSAIANIFGGFSEKTAIKHTCYFNTLADCKLLVNIPMDLEPNMQLPSKETLREILTGQFSKIGKLNVTKDWIKKVTDKIYGGNIVHMFSLVNYVYNAKEKASMIAQVQTNKSITFTDKPCYFLNMMHSSWQEVPTEIPNPLPPNRMIYIGSCRFKRMETFKRYMATKNISLDVYGNFGEQRTFDCFGSNAIYRGRLHYNDLGALYANHRTAVVMMDRNMENVSYYPTRVWEALKFNVVNIFTKEFALLSDRRWDEWTVSTSSDIVKMKKRFNDDAYYIDSLRKQRKIVAAITDSDDTIVTKLQRIIYDNMVRNAI